MRGEYERISRYTATGLELPPRARRIQISAGDAADLQGTTSACAENTPPDPLNAKTHGNYLRVRGEYRTCGACERFCGELPPRARRIHERDGWAHVLRGTTSACAENTWRAAQRDHDAGNYLRVRGEYRLKAGVIEKIMELPPRARRIRNDWCCHGSCGGTTSACAENTAVGRGRRLRKWNYLRVRGEYMLSWSKSCGSGELPPRARRIPVGGAVPVRQS